MRKVLVITLKDLHQRVRDRSILLLAVVAPIVITVVMNLAFGGASNLHFTVALVDEDHGHLAQAFGETLAGPGLADLLDVRTAPDRRAAEALIDGRSADAGFVIPAGFTAAVQSAGGQSRITVLQRSDLPIAGGLAQSLADAFVARLNGVSLAWRTAVAAGADPGSAQDLALAASQRPLPVDTSQVAGGTPLKAGSYYAAGMATFFLFFTVAFVGRGAVDEREQGTLVRLLAAPLRPQQVLLAKALSTFVIGCGAMAIMWATSTLAFDSPWGSPVAVVPLIVVEVLAAMGITAVVLTLARTDDAAQRWATIITMVLAIVGGNFINLFQLPGPLQVVSQLTPNGQFLRSVTDLVTAGSGLVAVLPSIAVIAGFAAVTGAVAMARSARMVRL